MADDEIAAEDLGGDDVIALDDDQRARSPGDSHPRPRTIPSSRFGQLPSEPVAYTRVKPHVVVELDVDTAIEHYRWRHACRLSGSAAI